MSSPFFQTSEHKLKHRLLTPWHGASWVLGLFGLLIAFGLTGCGQSTEPDTLLWPIVKECDLHTQSCTAQQPVAKVTLNISPHPIPIARPLGIEVQLEGLNPSEMQLDISGVNMYMGYNRVPLASKKPGMWVGTSMLAFCTTETMQWQITVMLVENGQQIQIPFYLETSNRSQ